ncbi:N-acetylmuramoyl-L-alanine amidase [Pseudomonas cichorii]|uniref:N-acetylmuramoyl-L-alanine amidase n=1 Tax=Pseudomonas cichorii TaxID=36746 RepID=UPI001F1E44AB|nr:N-acetylmuramoyl-L-alanine amidase [Pseudomonas cichorii]GFM88997.1 N-acetylmuramoyl-L-alanine amidase [Pseudomonas cichorii]
MNQTSTPSTLKDRASTDLIVVHCSATRATADIGVREITQWHIQRGFDTVGYHYVIRRNGELETGRAESTIGAHVRGHNSNSIGVCLAGGVDAKNKPENNFTLAQFATLETLLQQLQGRYPAARILGHRDLSPDRNGDGKITPDEFIKACPSFDVSEWWASRADAR